ncbi:MAG: hypothetical protein P4L11_02715 [Geothrix sp.]|nr:hypothetical protein [Geothrix sp.]
MSTAEVFPPQRTPADALPGALEARLAALAETVARLETRVSLLESALPEPKVSPEAALSPATVPPADLPNPVRILGLLGRTCLILGGATFIRSLVDTGTLPHGWGVALGLAYALTWALLADRARHPLDASFHALASILIVYPLIVESTARFGILTPPLAAALLLAATGLHGAVAWRRDLQPIIWLATFASLGSGLALMSSRRSVEPFLAGFLVLGIAALWLTRGRRWPGLRWPPALAADLGVFVLTSLAVWPGGIPEAYRGITPGRTMLFGTALVLLYLGSFALRLLRQRGPVTTFEIVQTGLVLLLGYGGALRVALASGSGAGLLGAGCSLAGLGSYAAARSFREDRDENRSSFRFFLFLGLGLLLMGGPLALPLALFSPLCGLLGLGAMRAGLRVQRPVFLLQGSLYLLASALASGLVTWSFRAFLAPQGAATFLPLSGLLSLVFLSVAVALASLRRSSGPIPANVHPLILFLGAGAAAGIGALAIQVGYAAASSGSADPGLLAAVRTGVLSALAILLAWCGRRSPVLDLRWLVYPLLIVTALKFLFEDVAVGRPLTLFLGFICYGVTLMLAPRLLKGSALRDQGQAHNPLKPEVHP